MYSVGFRAMAGYVNLPRLIESAASSARSAWNAHTSDTRASVCENLPLQAGKECPQNTDNGYFVVQTVTGPSPADNTECATSISCADYEHVGGKIRGVGEIYFEEPAWAKGRRFWWTATSTDHNVVFYPYGPTIAVQWADVGRVARHEFGHMFSLDDFNTSFHQGVMSSVDWWPNITEDDVGYLKQIYKDR